MAGESTQQTVTAAAGAGSILVDAAAAAGKAAGQSPRLAIVVFGTVAAILGATAIVTWGPPSGGASPAVHALEEGQRRIEDSVRALSERTHLIERSLYRIEGQLGAPAGSPAMGDR
jgi:hypothetical protein